MDQCDSHIHRYGGRKLSCTKSHRRILSYRNYTWCYIETTASMVFLPKLHMMLYWGDCLHGFVTEITHDVILIEATACMVLLPKLHMMLYWDDSLHGLMVDIFPPSNTHNRGNYGGWNKKQTNKNQWSEAASSCIKNKIS